MSGTQLELDHNSDEVLKRLNEVLTRGADASEAFAEIASHLELSTRERFDTETAPDDTKWAAHADSTTAARAKQNLRVDRILHGETLNLRDGIHSGYGPDSVWISTGQPAAAYVARMQFGMEGIQEARPFLGLSESDQDVIVSILGDFLMQFD